MSNNLKLDAAIQEVFGSVDDMPKAGVIHKYYPYDIFITGYDENSSIINLITIRKNNGTYS